MNFNILRERRIYYIYLKKRNCTSLLKIDVKNKTKEWNMEVEKKKNRESMQKNNI